MLPFYVISTLLWVLMSNKMFNKIIAFFHKSQANNECQNIIHSYFSSYYKTEVVVVGLKMEWPYHVVVFQGTWILWFVHNQFRHLSKTIESPTGLSYLHQQNPLSNWAISPDYRLDMILQSKTHLTQTIMRCG